jgi:hypothetical protein
VGDFKEKTREKIHIKFFIGKKIKRDVGFRVKTCRYRQVLIKKSIFTYLENKKVQAQRTCTFTSKNLKISIILLLNIFQTQAFGFKHYEFGEK